MNLWDGQVQNFVNFVSTSILNLAFGADPHQILLLVRIPSAFLIFCSLSPEPMGEFWPNYDLHRHIIGREEKVIRSHFQGHTSILKFSNFDPLGPNDGFWPNFIYCNVGMI